MYVQQDVQMRWGKRYAPHFGHVVMLGVLSFQWELRRLSLRALETFPFGTAMCDTSLAKNQKSRKIIRDPGRRTGWDPGCRPGASCPFAKQGKALDP